MELAEGGADVSPGQDKKDNRDPNKVVGTV